MPKPEGAGAKGAEKSAGAQANRDEKQAGQMHPLYDAQGNVVGEVSQKDWRENGPQFYEAQGQFREPPAVVDSGQMEPAG